MNILLIGGTGIISNSLSHLLDSKGIHCFVLNRGLKNRSYKNHTMLCADIHDIDAVRKVLPDTHFDVVVNFINFAPLHIERDIELFKGKTDQYIFISSASVYQKPSSNYLITESTPLVNPYWEYSRNKIACEERLMREYRESGFPAVIVRPSLTYNQTLIPLAVNSWSKSYTVIDRVLNGKPLIVPGDGSSLWTITHADDFANGLSGLMGNQRTIGHSFHITSDEVLSWDDIYNEIGRALHRDVSIVHISSDQIIAFAPQLKGSLLGDKAVSTVFDNSKIKQFVPTFSASVSWAQGLRRSIAWFQQDPTRIEIDSEANALWDRMLAANRQFLHSAL